MIRHKFRGNKIQGHALTSCAIALAVILYPVVFLVYVLGAVFYTPFVALSLSSSLLGVGWLRDYAKSKTSAGGVK